MGRPPTKIFVLDTSVVLYDSGAFSAFDEHDVAVPVTVLEELDSFKKGNGVINLQARGFMRELDRLSEAHDLRQWTPINGADRGRFRVVTANGAGEEAYRVLGSRKNDHQILAAAVSVAHEENGREVILVTKDINLRVKARGLGLAAEDYESLRVTDPDFLYRGKSAVDLDDESVSRFYEDGFLAWDSVTDEEPPAHHYFILRSPNASALARFVPASGRLDRVHKVSAYGVSPRNAEQIFALDAILDPGIPLVSITGPAGTGKTLLALAGALEQRRNFNQIHLARPVVPLGNKDLGYLPGDIDSKLSPYMEPLWDNLRFIKQQYSQGQKEYRAIDQMIETEKLHVMPLAFIRGRSLSRDMVIIDEAQNLTPHEIKTIISRAGEGAKLIFTGDIFQIDTPYLDSATNGLSYLIDRVRGNPLYAHITLEKGERSELANLASSML